MMVHTKCEHRPEVTIQPFIAPSKTANLFNFMAETLHRVTVFVPVITRLWLLVAITAHWSDHHSSYVWDHLDQIIGLICLVGNHLSGFKPWMISES